MGVVISLDDKLSSTPSIEPLMRLVAADMERVNQLIISKVGSDVALIPEIARHLIDSGGKRLRPMLTLATAALCNYTGEGHIKLATSVEFMHTATLLHDDVVDQSELRRGKLAARMLWGNEASVLVGDFLLGQAFRMMVDVGSLQALDVLSTAATVIAEGEVMQLSAAKNTATTEDEYLAVVRAKTAALFAAACEVGPIRRGNDAERAFWKEALEAGEASDTHLDKAMGLMTKHRSIEDTIERSRHYGAMAHDALELFPQTPMKAALVEAIEFCISRAH